MCSASCCHQTCSCTWNVTLDDGSVDCSAVFPQHAVLLMVAAILPAAQAAVLPASRRLMTRRPSTCTAKHTAWASRRIQCLEQHRTCSSRPTTAMNGAAPPPPTNCYTARAAHRPPLAPVGGGIACKYHGTPLQANTEGLRGLGGVQAVTFAGPCTVGLLAPGCCRLPAPRCMPRPWSADCYCAASGAPTRAERRPRPLRPHSLAPATPSSCPVHGALITPRSAFPARIAIQGPCLAPSKRPAELEFAAAAVGAAGWQPARSASRRRSAS